MRPTAPVAACAACLALLLVAAAVAAPLLPPSLSIRKPENAVAVVTALEIVEPDKVRFRRDLVLQEDRALEQTGEAPPEEVVVNVGEAVVAEIEIGTSYVLGYTSLNKLLDQRHTFSPDPDGSRIVELPSVGPALLEDTPEMRAFATPRPADAELEPRERLDLIRAVAARPNARGQLFALAELVLWTDLREAYEADDLAHFQKLLEGGKLEPRAREYALRAFVPVHEQVGEEWLLEECRRVLAQHEPELDLLSPHPSLVRVALLAMREMDGSAEDGAMALEFLHSNSDSVSLVAFETAAQLAPDHTEEVMTNIVLVGDLPLDTERAAIRFLAERQTARRDADG